MRRFILLVVIVWLGVPRAALSQAKVAKVSTPPVTWCGTLVARNVNWARQTAFLNLSLPAADFVPSELLLLSADTAALRSSTPSSPLKPYLSVLLDGIARSYLAVHARLADRARSLPAGEPRYGPQVFRTAVRFDLRGDGQVDSLRAVGIGDSVFAADLVAAVKATADRGDTFGPYGSDTLRTALLLSVISDRAPGEVLWPAFTVEAPVLREASAVSGNPQPRYPSIGYAWKAKLLYQFVIDEEGRVVPGTIKNLRPVESIAWRSGDKGLRSAYESFVREVEQVLGRWRFVPADVLGCRVKQLVKQAVNFEVR